MKEEDKEKRGRERVEAQGEGVRREREQVCCYERTVSKVSSACWRGPFWMKRGGGERGGGVLEGEDEGPGRRNGKWRWSH